MTNRGLTEAARVLRYCEEGHEPYAGMLPIMARALAIHDVRLIDEILTPFETIVRTFASTEASPENCKQLHLALCLAIERLRKKCDSDPSLLCQEPELREK